MRGCCASESQEISALLSALTGVTFDVTVPGEEHCESLATERVVWDRRENVPDRFPPALPDCVRIGFADQDRITPRLFLTIALQTVDELMKSGGRLVSQDQIQLVSGAIRPTVRVDSARGTTSERNAADEAERVRRAQEVLVQLAEAGKLTEGDSITPLQTSMASMSELREALFKTYKALEPSGDYTSFFWKGICRPMLGISWEDKVAVKRNRRGGVGNFVCDRCKPGEVMSLPVPSKVTTNVLSQHPNMQDFIPDDHHLPLKDWVVLGPDGEAYTPRGQWPPLETVKGTWKRITRMSERELGRKSRDEGLVTSIPWVSTWHPVNIFSGPLPGFFTSEDEAGNLMADQMDRHISRWRVVNLDDLVKSYRLSTQVISQLECDAHEITKRCDILCPHPYEHYIGEYAQAYVVLEFSPRGERSRLRLATTPCCLFEYTTMSSFEAARRGAAFWNQVRADAGSANDVDYVPYSAVRDGVGNSNK